jgi:putative spermidine/putrescine transport system ATP-binding protein
MSDRLAVMNNGRIEQIGTPADVYERPSTGFVAGFVGISNVLSGEVASRVTGSEAPFTVRPEKIRLAERAERPGDQELGALGRVSEVIYVGANTRYVVDLDGGGQLVVLQQNLSMSSMDALDVRGREVSLIWRSEHNRPITQELREGERKGDA